MVESESDLSGVQVRASWPVVVLSGDAPSGDEDDLAAARGQGGTHQMLPAAASWGRTFATVPFAGTAGSSFRVIGLYDRKEAVQTWTTLFKIVN